MRIGVLRGGTDENYENSLEQGGDFISFVFDNMSSAYTTVDILVDRDGVWHIGGLPILPAELLKKVDVVWNASHPSFSNTIKNFSIPTIGVPSYYSFMNSSREMLREHMKQIGIKMPRHIILPAYQADFDDPREEYAITKAKEIHAKFGAPWLVSTFPPSPNVGIRVAKTFGELAEAIDELMKKGESILIEELITGKDAQVHSVGGFRGEDIYTMPIAGLSGAEKEKLTALAEDLYRHTGASSYMNSHFIVHPRGAIYLTDIQFSPDLAEGSNFCQACELIGAKPSHIIEHLLAQVL
jgi:D-alanine-D-alanine ligase-like ATP-grasp enzyme